MVRINTRSKVIDNLNNVGGSDLLAGYQPADKEENDASYSYYGFVDSDENWYIMRVTTTDIDFVRGIINYTTNWGNRASLTYVKFNQSF